MLKIGGRFTTKTLRDTKFHKEILVLKGMKNLEQNFFNYQEFI